MTTVWSVVAEWDRVCAGLRRLDEVALNLRRIGWRNIYGGMYVKRMGWLW